MSLYHSARGSVSYDIVGNPTIINGIVSGLSSSDYVQENTTFNISATNKVDIFTKVTTGATVSTSNIIGHKWDSRFGIYLQGDKPSAMYYYYNGTSNTVSQNNSSISLQPNTTYYLKATFDLLNHSSTIAVSTDKENWTENTKGLTDFVSFPSYQISYQIGYSSSGVFQGAIDLNETYVKVDEQPWLGICPIEVKKHQLRGPVGYEVVGNPTIVNGIVSGFSYANKLFVPNFQGVVNYEFDVAFKSTLEQQQPIFSIDTGQTTFLRLATNGNLIFYIVFNYTLANAVALQSGVGTISANTDYIVRLKGQNGVHIMSLSSDGGHSWNQLDSVASDSSLPSGTVNFGSATFIYTQYYNGSIDLNKTYIKSNEKLWFWQPRETEKIVVNGVEVWSKQ